MRACRAVISPVVSGAPSLSSSMLIIYQHESMCPDAHTHSLYTFKVHTLYGFTYGVRYTRRTHAQTQTTTLTPVSDSTVSVTHSHTKELVESLTVKLETHARRTWHAHAPAAGSRELIAPHTFGFALHKISFSRHQVFKHLVTPGDASSGRGGKG